MLSAAHTSQVGRGGQWLIDRNNITVDGGASDSNVASAPAYATDA